MAENTKIQWTTATWNPWHGCTKVSPGCKFCYMYRDKERYNQRPEIVLRSKTTFNQPLKMAEPQMIFTCSWSDFFIEEADDWRPEAWDIIRQCPHHTFQILTKRPDRIREHLPPFWDELTNVWIGVSIESQEYTSRAWILSQIPGPALKFISFEPLLGPISWTKAMDFMDWIILGGESGNETGRYKYRPAEMSWFAHLIEDAKDARIPVFMKQLGTYQAKVQGCKDRHGGTLEEWPEAFQVRQYPGHYDKEVADE